MPRKNIKKNYQNKKTKKKKRVNVDNNKENVYEKKVILQDAKHDDNIDLNGVDQPR